MSVLWLKNTSNISSVWVDPFVMLMYALYNVNPLLQENTINDLFFKSMFNSFEQAVIF
jgi:hypothetical protein